MVEDSDGAVARAAILKKLATDMGRTDDNGKRKQGKKTRTLYGGAGVGRPIVRGQGATNHQ